MKIWLLTIGEPVPLSPSYKSRLHRTGQFALWASCRAKVVWWTSAFDHFKKEFIVSKDTIIQTNGNLLIRVYRGCGYFNNISVRRFLDQNILAKKILREMQASQEKPDIIICALPPVELACAAVRYGEENSIPVVLDLRDMWPDIFVEHSPSILRCIVRPLLFPLFRQAKQAFRAADAIIGITDGFVDWGISKTNRVRTSLDASFSFAYNTIPPTGPNIEEANDYWDKLGVKANDGVFRICFFGTLGRQFDIPTAITASNILRKQGVQAQFVLCGDGDKITEFKELAGKNTDILFPGWVDAAAIYALMRRSSVGLAPLPDRYDYLATINNKSVEYLSAGLPILSCPAKGTLFTFLANNKCGMSFNYGDAESLAGIVSNLISSPSIVTQMSTNAAKAFESGFVAENVNAKMFQHLELVVREYNAGKVLPGGKMIKL